MLQLNRNISTYFAVIVLIFIIGGCTASYYKLQSEDKDIDYYKGREVAYRENDSFNSSVSFEDQEGKNFVFYVTIENISDTPVTVNPVEFYADQLDINKIMLDAKTGNRFYAIDPAKHLESLTLSLKNRENWHNAVSGINLTFALVSVAADLANDKNRDKLSDVGNDIANWADNQNAEENSYAIDRNKYKSRIDFWKNGVLRKTTLYKNNREEGYVFIPFNPGAKYIRLVISAAGQKEIYIFKKIEIN